MKLDIENASSSSKRSEKIVAENEFNFPFEPYDIQLKLMEAAYDVYENSLFALLESPTGTGKSLSLICSSLTWLKNNQHQVKQELESKKAILLSKIEEFKRKEEESGDWLSVQAKRRDVNKDLDEINKELDRLNNFELKAQARWHAKTHAISFEDYNILNNNKVAKGDGDTDCLKRDNEETDGTKFLCSSQDSNRTEEVDENDFEKKLKDQQEEEHLTPKIYYASRTHSQLSQFIGEIKRTKFAETVKGPAIKVTPLASRANLCANPDVIKLKDASAINERCIEMQRESKAEKKCPYLKGKQINLLKEEILSSVQDIEDIVSRGKTIGSCPYYASRMSIPEAEVVVLPYNNLFHHDTRKASSLNLKDSIVLVDEAHNILETICSIHSAQINGQHLISSHTILSRYHEKFHTRMSPKNAATIKTIVQCLTALIRYLDDPENHVAKYENPKSINLDDSISQVEVKNKVKSEFRQTTSDQKELMIDVVKFMGAANIESFNVFKIIDYFNRSQLARKLIGFFRQDSNIDLSLDLSANNGDNIESKQKLKNDKGPPTKKRKVLDKQQVVGHNQTLDDESKSEQTNLLFLRNKNANIEKSDTSILPYPVYTLVEFLKSLTNLAHDGKVLTNYIDGDIQQSVLKFILLNPSSQFKQITEEARCLVLAGGTMQPFSEFSDLLFGPLGIDEKRLKIFSCEHVIEPDQLYVTTLSNGSSGKALELSYKTRSSYEYIDEIGRTIMNFANVIPAGIVCFLPSYEYEQFCFKRWSQIGIIANIETKCKQVFREPRTTSHLKLILDEYSKAIERGQSKGRGALLLCVVGGKMSEGINFNDDLGRCIIMVGLPYANIKSGELKQKMLYYDRTCKQPKATEEGFQLSAGQQYYENLCIKGINQSIGRAVRHKKDYAAIILLDRRYGIKNSIRKGLPCWMRKNLIDHDRFGPCLGQVKTFFNKMSAKLPPELSC